MFGELYDDDDGYQDVNENTRQFLRGNRNRVLDITSWRRPDTGFMGLLNQAATCYLNSLIQSLYMTPEFRESILSLSPEDLGTTTSSVEIEIEVNDIIKNQLMSMGFTDRAATASLVLYPDDEERSLNWLLENGFDEDAVNAVKITERNDVTKERKSTKIIKQVQKLFAILRDGQQKATSTEPLTASFGWNRGNVGTQHDVHELNRVLFQALESCLKKTKFTDLINNLYAGEWVNKTICTECGYTSERAEHYQDIGIPLYDMQSLYESLDNITTYEDLTDDNQYFCETCDHKVDAKRGGVIRKLPQILILSLIRFEFSMQTFSRAKNVTQFPFPLVLDMYPYTEEFKNKEEKKEVLEGSFNFFKGSSTDDLPDLLLGDIESESEHLYDLFSVIIHVGKGTTSGHYHAYIRDLQNQGNSDIQSDPELTEFGTWYDFNDSSVTPINTKKIAKQYGGGSECAYMLVYRKRGDFPIPTQDTLPHIQAIIEEHNKLMQEEELAYIDSLNTIELDVYLEQYYNVQDNKLVVKEVVPEGDNDDEASEGGFFGMYSDSDDVAPAQNDKYFKTIEIDQRLSIAQLEEKIRGLLPDMDVDTFKISEFVGKDNTVRTMKLMFDGEDNSKSIKDCGIENGMHLLLWNNETVNGVPFDINESKITINVKNYETDKIDPIDVVESITISELKDLLQDKYGHQDGAVHVTKIQNRASYSLDEDLTLFDAGVEHGNTLSYEKIPPEHVEDVYQFHFISKVNKEMEILKQSVSIRIIDLVTNPSDDVEECKLIVQEFPKSTTLTELKAIACSTFGISDLDSISLKRFFDGKPSNPFSIETLTLDYINVEDGDAIALELAESGQGRVPLTVIIGIEGKRHFGNQEVLSEETWTVKQLKEFICKRIEHDPTDARLHLSDIWDEPSTLLTDEDKRLKRYKIHEGDVLWLQSGKAPYKGQIDINLQLYTVLRDEETIYSPLCHLTYKSKIGTKNIDYTLEEIGTFDFSCLNTLSELKQHILSTFAQFENIPNENYMRLWQDTRLLREKTSSLKKQNIGINTTLTVEILDHEETKQGNLLYLHKRISETESFEKLGGHIWNGSSFPELVIYLSDLLDINYRNLLLAIYDVKNNHWVIQYDSRQDIRIIEEHLEDPTKKSKNKKIFSHGSVIALKDLSKDPEDKDLFAQTSESLGIDVSVFYAQDALVINVETDSSED